MQATFQNSCVGEKGCQAALSEPWIFGRCNVQTERGTTKPLLLTGIKSLSGKDVIKIIPMIACPMY